VGSTTNSTNSLYSLYSLNNLNNHRVRAWTTTFTASMLSRSKRNHGGVAATAGEMVVSHARRIVKSHGIEAGQHNEAIHPKVGSGLQSRPCPCRQRT
jgi:hypothetical protein